VRREGFSLLGSEGSVRPGKIEPPEGGDRAHTDRDRSTEEASAHESTLLEVRIGKQASLGHWAKSDPDKNTTVRGREKGKGPRLEGKAEKARRYV